MRVVDSIWPIAAGTLLLSACCTSPKTPPAATGLYSSPQAGIRSFKDPMVPIRDQPCPMKDDPLRVIRLKIRADALKTSVAQFCVNCFSSFITTASDGDGQVNDMGFESPLNNPASNVALDDYTTPWDFDINHLPTVFEIKLEDPNIAFWHPHPGTGPASDVVDVDRNHAQHFSCIRQVSPNMVSFFISTSLPSTQAHGDAASINIKLLLANQPIVPGTAQLILPIAIDPHPTNNGVNLLQDRAPAPP